MGRPTNEQIINKALKDAYFVQVRETKPDGVVTIKTLVSDKAVNITRYLELSKTATGKKYEVMAGTEHVTNVTSEMVQMLECLF